ncbi:MAG: hypothetical protein IJW03_04520 [Clostridia bacterium]|nr:hypothetical protein [Clostridia bacterium]
MNEDYPLLKKRFIELAKKSYGSDIFTFTQFLGLAEQSAFSEILSEIRGIKYSTFGGADGAERVMIRFGDPDTFGYEIPFPIVTVKIEPVNQKFADSLTHRDFLGAILNLGIERETLGDIVIIDNVGYLFANEDIAPYIIDSLVRVKHTDVRLSYADELPEGELYRTEPRGIQASSERLDGVIAKVFSLSREDAQNLFARRLVFVNGRCIESTSHIAKENDVISVRGYGRMIYRGCQSLSRKGKLNILVDKYI